MRNYLLGLIFIMSPVMAADQVNLQPFESVTVMCDVGNGICPEPEQPSIFAQKHGYQHPWRADQLEEDCTVCHSMYGDDGIITSKDVNCASVEEFVPPLGVGHITDISDAGIQFSTTGTKVGYLPKATPVKCYSCHEEVEVYVNGEEEEFEFEDIRKQVLATLDGGTEPPVEPPPEGDIYQCNSKEMQEKHDFTLTPDTNCAACHNDGRTCQ